MLSFLARFYLVTCSYCQSSVCSQCRYLSSKRTDIRWFCNSCQVRFLIGLLMSRGRTENVRQWPVHNGTFTIKYHRVHFKLALDDTILSHSIGKLGRNASWERQEKPVPKQYKIILFFHMYQKFFVHGIRYLLYN